MYLRLSKYPWRIGYQTRCLENRETFPIFENTFFLKPGPSLSLFASGWSHPFRGFSNRCKFRELFSNEQIRSWKFLSTASFCFLLINCTIRFGYLEIIPYLCPLHDAVMRMRRQMRTNTLMICLVAPKQ